MRNENRSFEREKGISERERNKRRAEIKQRTANSEQRGELAIIQRKENEGESACQWNQAMREACGRDEMVGQRQKRVSGQRAAGGDS